MFDESVFRSGRPVVLRGGTVLPMDDPRTVLPRTDVLVQGDRIAAIGPHLSVPHDTVVIDASDGIVIPGMIDTHRHMWQTAMRGYGADWTLGQYYVWYFLDHGRHFRPEDIYAGNLLAAAEAMDAGVTTTVDWSHGLRTVDHADAAVDALQAVPARFVLAYGNLHRAPAQWATESALRSFLDRRVPRDGMLDLQLAIDVTGDPAFPERPAFEVARDLGAAVTTHAGVWGGPRDSSIRVMYEHGFMTPGTIYVHAASLTEDSYRRIADTGGSISVSAESEQHAGQGYPPTHAARAHSIPVSLSMDTSVWWSADLFSAMRATLASDRSLEHAKAHGAGEALTHTSLRAHDVLAWATRGGADALGRSHDLGTIETGKKADLVLIKNDNSPVSFPLLNPHGHVVLQSQRADVHSVLVDGRVVKHQHRLLGVDLASVRRTVEQTVGHLRERLGEKEWQKGMDMPVPEEKALNFGVG
ncbi:amidohydrolase family protein [Streptomyces sp. NBC_00872]|uniref:amidohydrolase family protein n=1 Tax=Streptomyces sp. NBC_00872 TaxID=2903686 RepID=UPI003869DD5E|nr:amidohydrolase family protein [Streptomyces sp. NBC_00872]